jgi:hypothetical protein
MYDTRAVNLISRFRPTSEMVWRLRNFRDGKPLRHLRNSGIDSQSSVQSTITLVNAKAARLDPALHDSEVERCGAKESGVQGTRLVARTNESMAPEIADSWALDWLWGLPLIVLNVLIHAAGLGLINRQVTSTLSRECLVRERSVVPVFVVGGAVLSVTILHGLEGAIWAVAYRLLGALRENKSAMLYSLNALTSYGHENLQLDLRWQMMGALESLNGWILFGLTTAFLFTVMQKMARP